MDFFGILYDIKNGKKVPYSKTYFDTLFAAKLAQLEIKTLTGTLPLTFRTSETALRSWTIYGNNYEHKYSTSGTLPLTFTTHTAGNADDWSIIGNDNIGKNYYLVPNSSTTANVTFTTDVTAGTVTASGTASDSTSGALFYRIDGFPEGNYYFSGCPEGGGTSSYNIHIYDIVTRNRAVSWDKTTLSSRCYSPTDQSQVHLYSDHTYRLTMQVLDGVTVNDIVFKPMLRPADTSPEFEPYQIGVGQRTKNLFPSAAAETKTVGNLSVTSDGNGGYTINKTGALGEETIVTFDIPEFTIPVSQGQGGNGVIAFFNTQMTTGFQIWFYYDDTYITYYSLSTAANRVITNYADLSGVTINKIGFRMTSTSSTATVTGTLTPMTVDDGVAPTTFIPYGYEVPLTIHNTTQDIYIGSTPLTAGQSVSKASTGIDIAAIAGSNTITTELYNKPEMAIEGVDYVGVGRPRGQDWEIRLVCVGELSPYKPNAPESNTSYVYNATDYTLDTDSRYKTALIDIGEGHHKIFTIGKTKGETFTIQPLDYMAEWGGVDHYNQIGQTITPTEETYTGETAAQYLLVTYYDSEVDTLTPKEIRESITLTATVDANTIIPIDAPLTEGQTVTKESTGVDIETFPHAVNTLMEYATESSNIEMTITYKGG